MIWYPRDHDVERVRFFVLVEEPGRQSRLTLWHIPGDTRWLLSRYHEDRSREEIRYVSTGDVPWMLDHPEEVLMETML